METRVFRFLYGRDFVRSILMQIINNDWARATRSRAGDVA